MEFFDIPWNVAWNSMHIEESQFVIKMEIETESSGSSNRLSSSKSGVKRNLDSFLQPLAAASSSSFSSLSSSSSSSSQAEIKWVDRSLDPAFDSPIWKLDLLQCSESKINGSYLVKCVVCEQHHTLIQTIELKFQDCAERRAINVDYCRVKS